MKKIISTFIALIAVVALAMSTVVTSFAVDLSKDGEYTVNVYLVQKEKDEKTPASKGVLEQAKIEVKNGKATMIIDTQPVKVTGITATLQAMTVFPGTEEVNGKEAKVVSRNAKGDPNKFSFELPHTKNFIDIRVYTGLAFPKSIGSRLKVDWSSLKLVKAASVATTKATTKTTTATTVKADETTTAAGETTTAKADETTTAAEVKETTSATDVTVSETVTENADTIQDEPNTEEDNYETGEVSDSEMKSSDTKSVLKIAIPVAAAVVVIAVAAVIIIKKKKN